MLYVPGLGPVTLYQPHSTPPPSCYWPGGWSRLLPPIGPPACASFYKWLSASTHLQLNNIAAMSFTTLPEVVKRHVLSLLNGADRDGLVLAYPELADLARSVTRVWLDASNRHHIVMKSQARLQAIGLPGPYTDTTLQNLVFRWCGRVSRKLKGNEFHAADAHPGEFQWLGSLRSNLLH